MKGIGEYESADGTVYVGSWLDDEKHGLGIKRYKNGDVYEGLWQNGKPEGPGMYRWTDGSEYNGEWVRNLCNPPHMCTTFGLLPADRNTAVPISSIVSRNLTARADYFEYNSRVFNSGDAQGYV